MKKSSNASAKLIFFLTIASSLRLARDMRVICKKSLDFLIF